MLSRRWKKTGRRVQGVVEGNRGSRWAGFVLRHPVPVLLATVGGLVVLALPVLSLQLGRTGDEAKPKAAVATIEQRIGATNGVVSVTTPRFNAAGDTVVFSAVPPRRPPV